MWAVWNNAWTRLLTRNTCWWQKLLHSDSLSTESSGDNAASHVCRRTCVRSARFFWVSQKVPTTDQVRTLRLSEEFQQTCPVSTSVPPNPDQWHRQPVSREEQAGKLEIWLSVPPIRIVWDKSPNTKIHACCTSIQSSSCSSQTAPTSEGAQQHECFVLNCAICRLKSQRCGSPRKL